MRREIEHTSVAVGDDETLIFIRIALDQRQACDRTLEGMGEPWFKCDKAIEVTLRKLGFARAAGDKNSDQRATTLPNRQPEAIVIAE